MKFTLSWLKEHLETDKSLEALCAKLTAIGLEVEGVEDPSASLAPFKIAQIVSAEKHPSADRLKLCTVNAGAEMLQVVCGAPNARAGLKVVLARPGDVIPSTGEALKLSKIRGVESQGMMCSAAELKLSDDSEGIIELPDDAPVGESYVAFSGLGDPVIEINLTPNRGDCAGVRGIARDLAAAGMGKLKPLDAAPVASVEKSRVNVRLDFTDETKDACPLFAGRLIRNIKNRPSPAWLQARLRAIGLRPISALVDITNYMCFAFARPMHVFDAGVIRGDLRVHLTKGGESFAALNEKTYTLTPGITAISDDTGVLSLAGVMGGASTGCEADTVDVFLESANFDPVRTAHTGRALQLPSDARYRFERGVDPAFVLPGLEIATRLVLNMCGTEETVVAEPVIAGAVTDAAQVLAYDPAQCAKHIGVDVAADEQATILKALGFGVEKDGAAFRVSVPSWRHDIECELDFTEEVMRIKGFDLIPAVSMPRTTVVTEGALDLDDRRAGQARRALASQGLMEAVTWSFMPSKEAALFEGTNPALRLSNPISADLDHMRPSILGNLIAAAKRNADRGYGDVGLFEIGPVFKEPTPEGQPMAIALIRAGSTVRHWAETTRAVDAFDAKQDALAALAACGAPMGSIQISTDAPAWFHPGRSGTFRLGPVVLGHFGEIHPSVLAAYDIAGPVVGAELALGAIPAPRKATTARSLLKLDVLQPVRRDFAFVCDAAVTAEKLIKTLRGADKALIRDVQIFDVYTGKGVEAGKKSVAISVTLQPTGVALTDEQIDAVAAKLAAAVLKETGGELRR
jgi:phenylalanyl-tRNA synthetase beta chain